MESRMPRSSPQHAAPASARAFRSVVNLNGGVIVQLYEVAERYRKFHPFRRAERVALQGILQRGDDDRETQRVETAFEQAQIVRKASQRAPLIGRDLSKCSEHGFPNRSSHRWFPECRIPAFSDGRIDQIAGDAKIERSASVRHRRALDLRASVFQYAAMNVPLEQRATHERLAGEHALASGAATALSIETATTLSSLAELKPDYDRLLLVTGNVLPFSLHEWHLSWCTHFLNLDPNIHDRQVILVVRNTPGLCVAIIPLIFSRRRFGPVGIVSVDLLGGDPSTTESRTPLVEPGFEQPVASAVNRWLTQEKEWDWISWGGISGAFGDALIAVGRTSMFPEPSGYVLDLPPSWEQFRAGLKRNIRESLRHCFNSLKRDGHHFEFEVVAEAAGVGPGITRFLELHAMRASLVDTVEHPNHFASDVSQRFLHDICERLAYSGITRIFQLRIGGEVVACRIGFVVGDSLYLYYSGFDPRWGNYSVMTTTVAETLKYAIGTGLKTVNLSRGSDQSKTRWGPRVVEYRGGLDRRERLKSRIAHQLYLGARSGKGISSFLLAPFKRARRTWR